LAVWPLQDSELTSSKYIHEFITAINGEGISEIGQHMVKL